VIVVIIGIVLLMFNVCACGAVIYQKHKVREREDNLRRRIKRLSDAGMIRPGGPDTSDLETSRYCVSSGNDQACHHDLNEDCEDDDEDEDSSSLHREQDSVDMYVIHHDHYLAAGPHGVHPQHHHAAAYHQHAGTLKSAMRPPRPLDIGNRSGDDYCVEQGPLFNQDLRYSSRSMGNNLDSSSASVPIHMNGTSRSIAALDVLPRVAAAAGQPVHTVIYNNEDNTVQQAAVRQPRRLVLPKVLPDLPGVCHSIRSRFANGSTTNSSASGSRPPSPIIEVIPVSDYETMYGRPPQHFMATSQPHYHPAVATSTIYSGVVYPVYSNNPTSRTSSTLPTNMSSRHYDYAPRGNFQQPLRPPFVQATNHWGTLQPVSAAAAARPSSGIMLQPQHRPLNLQPPPLSSTAVFPQQRPSAALQGLP
jgi:hypothetical protein